MLMAASAIFFLSTRMGDLLGSFAYERTGGFATCVGLTTLSTALILVVLRHVPRDLTNYGDASGSG